MQILKEIKVPTGEIYTAKGNKGVLEFLTVADYGKDANIKADFLGITRELNGVPNGTPMPLTEKWVITISTQYGCSMNCKFCDVPKVGPGRNVTKKIYISLPITGYNLNERHKFFARIENELTILGYKAVNPMSKPMSDSAPYTEHMKEDLRLLLGCDGIVVPNRWRCSKGCETERRVADACGIPVVGVIGEAHDLQILNAI